MDHVSEWHGGEESLRIGYGLLDRLECVLDRHVQRQARALGHGLREGASDDPGCVEGSFAG